MQSQQKVQDALVPRRVDLQSEPLMPVDDPPDDDPDEIFFKAVAEIDTQPLSPPQEIYWPTVFLLLLFFCSYVGGTIIALLTYPTVTVTVVPVTKRVTLIAPLALPTHTLAPVILMKSLTADTTGTDHQQARSASGTLIFYNGQASPQTIPLGTVFTGQDGVKVATDQTVAIPPGTPPTYGQASVTTHALVPGSAGNIAAGDINTSVALAVFVKNSAFTGGQNQRDYRSVAQRDQDRLTTQLHTILTQDIPQAFPLAPGEQVFPTDCAFKVSPNHQVGAEASTLTVAATETCRGIAYDSAQLSQQATSLFTQQAIPASNYQLIGDVRVRVLGVSPLTVSCTGWWAYTLSQDYEQFLAERIAGDNPQQAQQYLLHTGFLTHATIPQPLPKDPEHIHFQVLIGL